MLPFESLRDQLSVDHGAVRAGLPTLFSIMRNERFFLDAFFDHYRRLGIRQFLVLDDGSEDGSPEYFRSQPDCVLLRSDLKYGTPIAVRMPGGEVRNDRAGIFFKRVIPEKFCRGDYAVYADADEFLVLPPQVPDLPTLFRRLGEQSIDTVSASLVEFYPSSIRDLEGQPAPRSFEDLVALYPYFDGVQLIRFRPGMAPKRINGSATKRLFHRYGILRPRPPSKLIPSFIEKRLPGLPGKSATMKTPVVCWREGVWVADTHHANVRPTDKVLLTFAHFKFTHTWSQKIEEAIRLKSFAGKSEKYTGYSQLLRRMKADDASFAGPDTRRYSGPRDLEEAGLLMWGLD
jgi:hypothetical protein